MQERDAFSLRADARHFVDKLNSRLAAPRENAVEIIDRKADVVYSRSALLNESPDWRARVRGLQQLHQRLSGSKPSDAGAVRVVQRHLGETEHIAKKRYALPERPHCDADMRYANTTRSCWGH